MNLNGIAWTRRKVFVYWINIDENFSFHGLKAQLEMCESWKCFSVTAHDTAVPIFCQFFFYLWVSGWNVNLLRALKLNIFWEIENFFDRIFFPCHVTCVCRASERGRKKRNRSSGLTNEIVRRWNIFLRRTTYKTANLINKIFPPSSLLVFCPPFSSSFSPELKNSIAMKMFFQFKYLNFINSHNDVAEFKSEKRCGMEKSF